MIAHRTCAARLSIGSDLVPCRTCLRRLDSTLPPIPASTTRLQSVRRGARRPLPSRSRRSACAPARPASPPRHLRPVRRRRGPRPRLRPAVAAGCSCAAPAAVTGQPGAAGGAAHLPKFGTGGRGLHDRSRHSGARPVHAAEPARCAGLRLGTLRSMPLIAQNACCGRRTHAVTADR